MTAVDEAGNESPQTSLLATTAQTKRPDTTPPTAPGNRRHDRLGFGAADLGCLNR
ncbi:MAG: hypothetical protein IPM82_21290 [Saprospiraceae bacterium]|nr:hypothetical protein [Saprospiraceae bacterium]